MKTTGSGTSSISSRGKGEDKTKSRQEARDDAASPDDQEQEDDGLTPNLPGNVILNPKASDVRYHTIRLSDLVVEPAPGDDGRGAFSVSDREGRFSNVGASRRFLTGLTRKTEIRPDFFKLFTPAEVLKRVVERDGDQNLVLAQDAVNVLAVAKTDDPMIKLDEALAVIEGFKPTQVSYHDGELRAEFTPTRAAGDTQIVGETYSKKFIVSIPVDGLNHPAIAPLMIRQICENGMVAEAPTFISQITIGRRDAGYTVERALNAYNGDKFFTKIAEILELNKLSYASVAEVQQFVRLLIKSKIHHNLSTQLVNAVWKMSGTAAYQQYLHNEGKNPKLLRKLVTKLNRYDLINMVTEARTHLVGREDVRRDFDAFAGALLSRDPDLERSAEDNIKPSQAFFFRQTA